MITERAKRILQFDEWLGSDQGKAALVAKIDEAIQAAVKEERERCAEHADSVARRSALLPPGDPERDGPRVARWIEEHIKQGD